jgi:hypothetical protein
MKEAEDFFILRSEAKHLLMKRAVMIGDEARMEKRWI